MKSPKNILVVTYWDFSSALIKTYTLPYIKIILQQLPPGSKIYLFTLSKSRSESAQTDIKALSELGIHVLDFRYNAFGAIMLIKLCFILVYLACFSWLKKISYIHTWCTPGGAIGYIISMLTGKPLVLDSFEPHAETMVEGNTWKKDSLAYKLLFRLEKLQLRRAAEVICAAPGMDAYSQKKYGVVKNRYFVKPACVDLQLFDRGKYSGRQPAEGLKKIVCVYAGKFGGIYLEKEVFDFFKVAYDHWKEDFSVLLLTDYTDGQIKEHCRAAGLPDAVIVKKFVSHSEVPAWLAMGSFGICPVKPLPSKLYCTPIKNGEYWAMGLPVVITKDISSDSATIAANDIGYVLQSTGAPEYLRAVQKIDSLLKQDDLHRRIRSIAEKERNFSIAENIYKTIYA